MKKIQYGLNKTKIFGLAIFVAAMVSVPAFGASDSEQTIKNLQKITDEHSQQIKQLQEENKILRDKIQKMDESLKQIVREKEPTTWI